MSEHQQPASTFSLASSRIAALRRVSGAEVVDEGIQLARQNYGALLVAALAPTLPIFGMDFWRTSHAQPQNSWLSLSLSMALTTSCGSIAAAAAARVAMDALEGQSPDPTRGLAFALRRAWPVVVTGLFQGVVGLIGSFLLVIPGLCALSIYSLASVLPVLEPGGALQSLHRSETLTEGSRWLAFGAYVVPAQFVFAASVIMGVLTQRVLGPHAGRLFGALIGSSVALASIPFIAAIKVRMYIEMRMRKEGIDIEWAIASPPPATVAVS